MSQMSQIQLQLQLQCCNNDEFMVIPKTSYRLRLSIDNCRLVSITILSRNKTNCFVEIFDVKEKAIVLLRDIENILDLTFSITSNTVKLCDLSLQL